VYDVAGWAYYRRALALQKYAPDDFDVTMQDWDGFSKNARKHVLESDLIYNCEYSGAERAQHLIEQARQERHKKCVHVISYNSDGNRRTERWAAIYKRVDFIIANNRHAFDHFNRPKQSCNISNGVDAEVFKSSVPVADREDAALWCGSTAPKKTKCYAEVVKPIFDQYMSAPDTFPFRANFRPIDEIDHRVFDADGQNAWYNSAKVVLCTSKSEGTPNYLLEGIVAGCVPVTTMVGNALEWATPGVNCIEVPIGKIAATIEGIKEAIARCDELSAAAQKTFVEWHYERRAQYFFSLFRALIERGPKGVAPFTWQECEPEDIER